MKSRVALSPLAASDEKAFLQAVLRSRDLHHPWVSPPRVAREFRALVKRMNGSANVGFGVRLTDAAQLVGFIEVTNIVHGAFRSGYLGYYAFSGNEGRGLTKEALRQCIQFAFQVAIA